METSKLWICAIVALLWAGAASSFKGDAPRSASVGPKPPYEPAPAIAEHLKGLHKARGGSETVTPESVPGLWLSREMAARNIVAAIKVGGVRDLCVPARNRQIPLRVYSPAARGPAPKAGWPILVYYYGGGWMIGSIATSDSVARRLANQVPAVVVSVQYRLAPEYPFFVETARRFYLPNVQDWTDPDASPLRTPGNALAVSPPALVIVSGCDVLRDEGLAYVEKLRRCGVPVTCLLKKELTHGYLSFFNNPSTKEASKLAEGVLDEAAEQIRKGLAGDR